MATVTIDCACPGGRHPEGDTITLRDRLDFRTATTIRKSIALGSDDGTPLGAAEVLAILTEGYVLYGIEAWTLVDDRGKPLPVTRSSIRDRILDSPTAYVSATMIGDAADDLYGPQVLLPLLARASISSPPLPTEPSMSPKPGPAKLPRPSKRSSTSTTRTDGIEATSPSLAGVSSSSPSLTSA